MSDESSRVADLIESVADGNAVDWPAIEEGTADRDLLRALRDLRTIAGIARVHRSELDGEQDTLQSTPEAVPTDGIARWGHFLLLRMIGEGSFGEVYRARDTWLDHDVALKLLKAQHAERPRILHEARTLVKVRHPNVVTVHGADMHQGRVGFWMEFIEGHTLSQVVAREGVRSAGEAAIMGQELCRALAAVHSAGIIHRDIKAQNVMRESGSGRTVLMDFGAGEIAKAPRASGMPLMGTPLYLAPELLRDEAATPQSDIYALGVLLFYLVAGSFPVQGADFDDLVHAHARGDRRRLGDIRPNLPDNFVRVVDTMLAPAAANRYATASSARAALEAVVVSGHTTAVQTVAGVHPAPRGDDRWQRRLFYGAAVASAAVIVLTFLGLITSTMYNSPLGISVGSEADPPWLWPVWGVRALIPPAVLMGAAVFAFLVLRILARMLLAPLTSTRAWRDLVATRSGPLLESLGRVPTPTLASTLVMIQIAVVVLFAWRFRSLFEGLDSFVSQQAPNRLGVLGPENRAEHQLFGMTLYLQVLVFGWLWFRLLRPAWRQPHQDTRSIVLSGIALSALTLVAGQVVPYRVLYLNDAERVLYRSERCYVVEQRNTAVVLFCPSQPPPFSRTVPADDPALRREGLYENIFTGLIP